MRKDEAFLLGAMGGALLVWLLRPKLQHRLGTSRVRPKAADDVEAVEATVEPATS
jgi:hypothetical protein